MINSRSLLYGFPGIIKHVIHVSFWQSSSLLKAEVSMCIVSKHVIAFSLPFEIFIYIPILPHQQYCTIFFFITAAFPATFQFFPLLSCHLFPPFCPPVLFICPLFYASSLLSSPIFLTDLLHSLCPFSSSSSLSSSSAPFLNFKCNQTSGSY